ncbi:MAG: hypothetical protein ACI8P9_000010 [Parasphingorhabdus sp.]|jgi:hypothetical protein
MKKNSVICAFSLTCAICGGISNAGNVDELIEICLSSTNMGEEICTCMANKAVIELSPGGFNFMFANMQKDKVKAKEIASTLEVQEMTAAMMFTLKAPTACAKELSGQ